MQYFQLFYYKDLFFQVICSLLCVSVCVFVCVCVFIHSLGLWKVVAKFKSNPQQNYFAEFEVKEYGKLIVTHAVFKPANHLLIFHLMTNNSFFLYSVLPSFEVKLLPVVPFFYFDSEQLTINIKATYAMSFYYLQNRRKDHLFATFVLAVWFQTCLYFLIVGIYLIIRLMGLPTWCLVSLKQCEERTPTLSYTC